MFNNPNFSSLATGIDDSSYGKMTTIVDPAGHPHQLVELHLTYRRGAQDAEMTTRCTQRSLRLRGEKPGRPESKRP